MGKRRLGVDIGACAVRAVALVRRGKRWAVDGFAEVSRFDDKGARKPLARSLTELDSRLSLRGGISVVSSDLAVMVRFEHNDPMPADRLERVLRLELAQHAPGDDGDLAADAVLVPIDGDDVIHCCGLAQPDQVAELLTECATARCQVRRVQLAPAALGGVTRSLAPSDEDGFDLIIDLGGSTTRVVLARDDDLLACRQLPVGGDAFTEALAKARGWRFDQAEKAKIAGDHQALHGKAVTQPMVAAGATIEAGLDDDDAPLLVDVPSDPAPAVSASDEPLTLSLGEDSGLQPTPMAAGGLTGAVELEDESPQLGDESPQLGDESPQLGDESLQLGDEGLQLIQDPSSEVPRLSAEGDDEAEPPFALDEAPVEPITDNAAGVPEWRRDLSGFELDEPEVPDAGSMTQVIGGTVLGPDLIRVADDLYAQVTKTQAWFASQLRRSSLPIRRVRLVGAGADLGGLPAYLSRRMAKPVSVLQPFSALDGAVPDAPHHFAAALGVALAGTEGVPTWDLRPERIQANTVRRQLVWPPRIAAALLALAAIAAGIAVWREQAANADRIAAYQDQERAYKQALARHAALDRQRDEIVTDLTGIAGRIFAGRDLLYTIRALKEHAPESLWITSLQTQPATRAEQDGVAGGGRILRGGNSAPALRDKPDDIADTALDRGLVALQGIVRTAPDDDFLTLFRNIRLWREQILAWTPVDDVDARLFRDYDPVQWDFDRSEAGEAGDFEFEIHYFFAPTKLQPSQVATGGL